jgi:hypothetical protein
MGRLRPPLVHDLGLVQGPGLFVLLQNIPLGVASWLAPWALTDRAKIERRRVDRPPVLMPPGAEGIVDGDEIGARRGGLSLLKWPWE